MKKFSLRNTLFPSVLLAAFFLCIGVFFWHRDAAEFERRLHRESAELQDLFRIAEAQLERQMYVLASFVAADPKVRRAFLDGKEGEAEGPGGERAARARAELLEHLGPSWSDLQRQFGAQQLHFHLGPGAKSFLRVHAPERFGDRLDGVRAVIEDVNADGIPRSGFEIGRAFSGLRAVVPVKDPQGGRIGVLEAGMSLRSQVEYFDRLADAGVAVLLERRVVEETVWAEYLGLNGPLIEKTGSYLASTSRSEATPWLMSGSVPLGEEPLRSFKAAWGGRRWHVTTFPLHDYLHGRDPARPPVGMVVVWRDRSEPFAAHERHRRVDAAALVGGYVASQLLLLWLYGATRNSLQRRIDDVTAELRRSEEHFRGLFHRHDAVMLLVDPASGRIVDANAAAARFYGYPADLLRAMSVAEINMLGEEQIAAERRNALEQRRNYFIFPHRLADGEVRTVEVHSSPIETENGTLLFSIIHDITTRIEAEKALRESEAYNRLLFAESHVAMVVMDPAGGRFIDCNAAALRLYRVEDAKALVGRSPLDVSAPLQPDGTASAEAAQGRIEAARAGGSHRFEWRHRRPDGEIWDAEVHLMAFQHQGRQLLQFSLQDITERRRADALSRARLHLIDYALTHSLEEFLRETIDQAERLTASRIGFFHFLREDQQTLELQMWSSATLHRACTMDGAGMHYDVEKAGVWVDCVREGRAIIHNDYAALLHRRGLPEGHVPIERQLVVPLFRGESIVAILGVGNKTENYTSWDVETVSLLADLAWDTAARKRAESALLRVNERLGELVGEERAARAEVERLSRRNKVLLMAAGEGIYGVDRTGKLTFVNPAALRMLGFTLAEVLDADPHALFHHHRPDGSDYPAAKCPIFRTIEDGLSRRAEEWFIRKDGTGFAVQLVVNPVEEDGERDGAVVVFQDLTERKAYEAELRRLATTDALTGVANRRFFLERMDHELARFKRLGKPVALLMVDLDRFKRVNDTYGHAAGDDVLKHFARLAQQMLRKIDLIGRLGGEEFAVLLPGTDGEGALRFAERLRDAFAQTPARSGADDIRVTLSVGVTLLRKEDERVEALARADRALYRAKDEGRNRVGHEGL